MESKILSQVSGPISGKIQCKKISGSKAIRKFTDKQIRNWVQSNLSGRYKAPVVYRVELKRQGAGHTVDCHIQVHYGNQTWVGSNYEGELHQALIHCLRQMVPTPPTV